MIRYLRNIRVDNQAKNILQIKISLNSFEINQIQKTFEVAFYYKSIKHRLNKFYNFFISLSTIFIIRVIRNQIIKIQDIFMKGYLVLVLTLLCVNIVGAVPAASDQIFSDIFEKNKIYVLHAHLNQEPKNKQVFDHFCTQNEAPCADLDESYDNFGNVLQFLGCDLNQFIFILDTVREKKFVLDATETVTVQQLKSFYSSFQDKTLEPFYASEPVPESDSDKHFRHLVGSNLDDFLALPAPIKVLFLTTDNPICEVCSAMQQGLEIMSKNMTKNDVIIFGYIDIMKNDHRVITNEVFPYFLIFKQGRQLPIEVKGQDVEKLLDIIMENIESDLSPEQRQQLRKQKQQMDREQAAKQNQDEQDDDFKDNEQEQKKQSQEIKKQVIVDQEKEL